MAGTDLDRLVAAWKGIDFAAVRANAFSSDPNKPVTEPSLQAAESAENDFLDRFPDSSQRWFQLKARLFGPQIMDMWKGGREALAQHEKELGDAAAPLFWMGTPGRALVKGLSLGYLDPVKSLAPAGTAEGMDAYARTREGAAKIGARAYELGSDLGSFVVPMAGASALGRGLLRAAPAAGRIVQGAEAAAPLLTRLGKTAATAATVGAARKPEQGETRVGNAIDMAKYGLALGTTSALGEKFATKLLAGRAVGPIAEKLTGGLVGAAATGVGAASVAPSGERIEQGLIYGLASIAPNAFVPRGNGARAYERGLSDRVGRLRSAEKQQRAAMESGDKAAQYRASKEAQRLRDDVVGWRGNRDAIVAMESHGELKEVARQRAMSEQIGDATKRIQADDARLREIEAQEREASGLLSRVEEDVEPQHVAVSRRSIEKSLRDMQRERREILERRPGLEVEEVKYGLPGMRVEVFGKSKRTGKETSVRAVVATVNGESAVVVDGSGRKATVPLGSLRPIRPEQVQAERAAAAGRAQRPPAVAPEEPKGPEQGDLGLSGRYEPGRQPEPAPADVPQDVPRETPPAETAPAAPPEPAAAPAPHVPQASSGDPLRDEWRAAFNESERIFDELGGHHEVSSKDPRAKAAVQRENKAANRLAESRTRELQGLIKYMAARKLPVFRDAAKAARAELAAIRARDFQTADELRTKNDDVLVMVDRHREMSNIERGKWPAPLNDDEARRMARDERAEIERGPEPKKMPARKFSTGEPLTMRGFRGKGRDSAESVYAGPVKKALIGDATYYGLEPGVAKKYGPNIEERDITLRKPLVLTSDQQFRDLVRAAGIRYPKFWMDDPRVVDQESAKLRAHVEALGHDGIVVKNTADSHNEILGEAFGDDQIIVLKKDGARPEVPSAYEKPIGPQPQSEARPVQSLIGRETTVHTIKGKRGARFALVELDNLLPSHRVDTNRVTGVRQFVPDEAYPEGLQPRRYHELPSEAAKVERMAQELPDKVDLFLSDSPTATDGSPVITPEGPVLSGNGRSMSLLVARAIGTYDAYRKALMSKLDRYGIDPQQAEGMKSPVLVRVVDMDPRSDQAHSFARETNEALTQGQSIEDRMRALAAVIPEEALRLDVPEDTTLPEVLSGGSRAARAVIDAIHDALPENIRPSFFTERGQLNDAGKQAIGKLLLGSVVDPVLAEKQRPQILAQLTKAIPAMAAMRDLPESLNLRTHIEGALRYGLEKLDNWSHDVGQGFIGFNPFGELPPSEQAIVQHLSENRNRDTALRHLVTEYVHFAKSSQVFGVAHASAEDALAGALRKMQAEVRAKAEERAAAKRPPRGDQAGMVSFGRQAREVRRSWTRAMGGDHEKAGDKWAYNTLSEMRPQLAENFRTQNLETTLRSMAEAGLRPDQVQIVRLLESGVDPEDVRQQMAPDTTPPQFMAMAAAAYGHALDVADALHAKNALLFDQQNRRLMERVREWWDPSTPPELATHARLKERGEGAAVRTTEWWSPRRYAGELASSTSQEVANVVFDWQKRTETRLKGFRRSMDTAEGHLRRLAELTGDDKSGVEGLRKGLLGRNKLSVAEVAAFDALDGLRRILGREGTQQEVADFIDARVSEFEKLAPGAGRDWRNAVTIYRNMWTAVREQYRRTYGRDISANISEGLYAPHFFYDPVTGKMLPWARLSKFFSDPIRSRVWSRFEMSRSGREGYVPDITTVARSYFPGMLRKIALDTMLQERSPLSEVVFGRLSNARGDLGADVQHGVEGGALGDSPAGRRIAQWWNRIASNETVDDRRLQIWIPAGAAERLLDVNGTPIKTPGVSAEGGYYHYVRSGKPLAAGDRFLVLREARTGSPEIVLPLVDETGKSPLRFMQWFSGGLQDIATMYGQPGRRAAAVEWMRRMKTSERRAHWLIDNRVKDFLISVIFHNTLGVGQWKPIANNLAGGLLMCSYHAGLHATGEALGRYTNMTRGADQAARIALLRMGVVEEEGVFLERAGGTGEKFGSAVEAASKASFAGFSSAEKMLRSVAALAGHDKFLDYSSKELERICATNAIERSREMVFANGRLYVDGEVIPGSERLGSLLDSTKQPTRTVTRASLEKELEDQALLHGRASVAKTQFLYSASFTPQAFSGPVGRMVFQLNQYSIRSAFAMWDAIANERDPAKVSRWIATACVLGTTAYLVDWDVTSFVGPSIGSLVGSQTWDTDHETAAGQAKDLLASMPVPTPMPFSRGAPYIPLLSLAGGVWDVLKGTLGLDPANPLPTGDFKTADLWAQFGRSVEMADRKLQSTLFPNQWRKVYEYAEAPKDEKGRRMVQRRGGTLSPMSPGEFAAEQLIPGSRRATYGAFERSEQRAAREDEANRISRSYRENLAALEVEADPERRSFMERQNAALLKEHPELARVQGSDVRRLAELQGLPIEVGELAGSSLMERARGYFDWIEADRPGPDMLRKASVLLWGKDLSAVKQSIGELKKVDESLGNRVLGVYRKAVRGEPVTVP